MICPFCAKKTALADHSRCKFGLIGPGFAAKGKKCSKLRALTGILFNVHPNYQPIVQQN